MTLTLNVTAPIVHDLRSSFDNNNTVSMTFGQTKVYKTYAINRAENQHRKPQRAVSGPFYFQRAASKPHSCSLLSASLFFLLWNFKHFSAGKDRRKIRRTSNLISVADRLNFQIKEISFAVFDG